MNSSWWLLVGIPGLAFLLAFVTYNLNRQDGLLYMYESRAGYALRWATYRWLLALSDFFYESLLDIWNWVRGRESFGWTIGFIIDNLFEAPSNINYAARVRHMKRINDIHMRNIGR